MSEYQHLTQKAYLASWKIDGRLYLIDKHTTKVTTCQSANGILGMDNLQTAEMETAFNDAESNVGLLHSKSEIKDPKHIYLLPRWVALHAFRCKRHLSIITKIDYRLDVDNLTKYFQQLHACFIDSRDGAGKPVAAFITCDNPCLYLTREGIDFWIIPVSPFRYLCYVPFELWAESPPWDINRNIVEAATDHCVSFDVSLHTTNPRQKTSL